MKHLYNLAFLLFLTQMASAQSPTELLVVNEGGFGATNASLDIYSLENMTLSSEVYASANNDAILGDIAQSAYQFGQDLYVVVNNSHRIMRLDRVTFERKAMISFENQESPRSLVRDKYGNLFATLMGTGEVAVLNAESLEEIKRIKVGSWPDKIIINEDRVFVSNWGSSFFGSPDSTIMIIDAPTQVVVDTLVASLSPRNMVFDDAGNFWVLASEFGNPGKVHVFDTELKPLKTLEFDGGVGEDIFVNISNEVHSIFINHSGIGIRSISATTMDTEEEVYLEGSFYSFTISEGVGRILSVSDAKDFSQRGEVVIFNAEKSEIARFNSGVVPGHLVFLDQTSRVANEPIEIPESIDVIHNYPNPFNPTTTISVGFAKSGNYSLTIVDVTGRQLATLFQGNVQGGSEQIFNWNANGLASGLYIVMVQGPSSRLFHKMMLSK